MIPIRAFSLWSNIQFLLERGQPVDDAWVSIIHNIDSVRPHY